MKIPPSAISTEAVICFSEKSMIEMLKLPEGTRLLGIDLTVYSGVDSSGTAVNVKVQLSKQSLRKVLDGEEL